MEHVHPVPTRQQLTVEQRAPTSTFVPALEGLRGWAVLAVLLFHGRVLHADGGFLGVSVFFTLSGYLITTLAFVEMRRTGGFDWRSFASRRIRRLLPVAAVGVALAALVTLSIDDPYSMQRLVGDGASSLLQVANWRFIASGRDYAALFASPSAFAHYWSLSIEEQFYWAFAIVFALHIRRAGSRTAALRPSRVAAWAGAGWFGCLVLQLSGLLSGSVTYQATFTRSGEILAGVTLAGLLARSSTRTLLAGEGGRRAPTIGLGGALVVAGAWFLVDSPTGWITRGGLALYAVASSAVVLGCLASRGPIRWACSLTPARHLGRLSYALYVVHWPLFIWLSPARTGLATWPLFALRVAVSLALAWLSLRTIEAWARHGTAVVVRRLVIATTALATAALVVGGVVNRTHDGEQISFAAEESQFEAVTPAAARPSGPLVRMIAVGDSTALRTSTGVATVLASRGVVEAGGGDVELGCGLNDVVRSVRSGDVREVPERCDWSLRFPDTLARTQPDLVLVEFGPWETEDQQVSDGMPYEHLGDPMFDEFVRGEMTRLVELVTGQGARIVWLDIPPAGDIAFTRALDDIDPAEYDRRRERFNALLAEVGARYPDQVDVIDTSEWFASRRNDEQLRPDGIHLSADGSLDVAEAWLADRVERAIRHLDLRR